MTTTDLKNNRNRIIRNINSYRCCDLVVVMGRMVKTVENNSKYSEMKPTMANIDKLTKLVCESWIKNDYNPTPCNPNELGEINKENARKNLPSSMR